IVKSEVLGTPLSPSSSETVEAYVVPVCLMKAKRAGIRACEWEISYSYVPVPSIVYGIHYYSDPSEYTIVNSLEASAEVVKITTHNFKYPFCYQPIPHTSAVVSAVAIFGKTTYPDEKMADLASQVFEVFRIPLVTIIAVCRDGEYYLSSLAPIRFSKLTKEELSLLSEHVRGADLG
ncbi:MAG TPA: RimK-like ATPgrasp N-terminal domain-containing protein, partial [Methanomicrobiales archaeon]|nr:RimK-like ATPgrasp N-terminal domain-containing protein [Methanomicrobiales archaeon]